jgi:hypothetical protein
MRLSSLCLAAALVFACAASSFGQLPQGFGSGGQAIGGQGMGGQAINLGNGALGTGGQGMGGQALPFGNGGTAFPFGAAGGASGFSPGGQNMGGQGLSLNQYIAGQYMRGLAARGGNNGPKTGFNPYASQQPQQTQPTAMSLTPPRSSTLKLSKEESRAMVRARAEAQKAKAAEAKAARANKQK